VAHSKASTVKHQVSLPQQVRQPQYILAGFMCFYGHAITAAQSSCWDGSLIALLATRRSEDWIT
jgi:hypothetical protein